ncbi:MAG: twin-arginine translocase subunit TatC [Gemmatimonadota bacterium]
MENRFAAAITELDKARRGLAIYAAVVLAFTAAAFCFSERILVALVRLLNRKIVAYDPSEAFLSLVSLSFYCGIALSLPVGAWMVWRGVLAPRLPGMKRLGGAVIAVATLLFAGGVLLGYRVLLPSGIGFLAGFESRDVQALISARRFISFCGTMLIALGLSFEAPLLSYLLARIGWLGSGFFRKKWRHALLGCTVLAAVITPTPDVWNMTLMAVPLLGLYFVSFAVVWAVETTRRAPKP